MFVSPPVLECGITLGTSAADPLSQALIEYKPLSSIASNEYHTRLVS